MNGSRLLLVIAFLLALAAGLAAGVLASRLPMGAKTAPTPHSQLADELQLTPAQSDRMKLIWEGTRDSLDDCFASARTLQQQRDDAVVSLLTPEQKEKYVKINQDYVNQFADVTARREAAFQQAVKRTEEMLMPAQKLKYQEIIRSRMGQPGGQGGPGPAGMGPVEGGASHPPGPQRASPAARE
jgi:Spy/CpxP family protein refolding chaperone